MNQAQTVKKWGPILESYYKDLSDKTISFLSEYAERHSTNESMDVVHSGNVEVKTILPMALKTLVSCQILEYMHWYVRSFEVEVHPKSYSVTADYTQGRRDKVESIENGISEKISDEISKEAIENMFKLGEINRYYHRNHRSETVDRGFVPEAEHVLELDPSTFLSKMKKYLFGEAFKLSAGTPFIVCNPQIASILILKSDEGEYKHIQPLSKCMTMNRAFVVGEYCEAKVFVDPTMSATDFRVLFGSSNSEATGGLVFEPLHICHNMNVDSVSSEGLSKVTVQSSYRFHSGSENSKCAYLTVKFEFDK